MSNRPRRRGKATGRPVPFRPGRPDTAAAFNLLRSVLANGANISNWRTDGTVAEELIAGLVTVALRIADQHHPDAESFLAALDTLQAEELLGDLFGESTDHNDG